MSCSLSAPNFFSNKFSNFSRRATPCRTATTAAAAVVTTRTVQVLVFLPLALSATLLFSLLQIYLHSLLLLVHSIAFLPFLPSPHTAGWSQSQQRDYNFTTGQYAGGTYDSLSGTRRPTANELRAMILNRDSDSNATSAPAPAATSVASKPSVRDSLDQDFDILSRLAPPSTSVQSTKPTNSIDLGATGKPVPMGDVDFSQAGQMFLQMSNQLKEARAQSTKVGIYFSITFLSS
jgi:hypothetical protein